MQSKHSVVFMGLLVVSTMAAPTAWSAEACVPPPGFVDTPHPTLAPVEQLFSHTEEVTHEHPYAVVRASAARARLEETIDRTGDLPGVAGIYRLTTDVRFPQPGARRLLCLTDGTAISEQVLENEQKPGLSRYRYVVWNYTSPKFPPISYAIGVIVNTAVGPERTHVRWTYSFQPDRSRRPESPGAESDREFRENFVDGQFAQRMRKSMANGKKNVDEFAATPEASSARDSVPTR